MRIYLVSERVIPDGMQFWQTWQRSGVFTPSRPGNNVLQQDIRTDLEAVLAGTATMDVFARFVV